MLFFGISEPINYEGILIKNQESTVRTRALPPCTLVCVIQIVENIDFGSKLTRRWILSERFRKGGLWAKICRKRRFWVNIE